MALTQVNSGGIGDGSIVNADLHSSANIASTKLAKPVDFADNEKARFGTGNDLEIFHDGNNSSIDSKTGDLLIRNLGTTGDIYLDAKTGERGIKIIRDGAVILYHNGSEKFTTTSSGVEVTGTLQVGGAEVATTANTVSTGKAVAMAMIFG
jgi:hypothetical protein|tara:strand:+ start:120 stop:572 length:453 start_codon:yes stop_codon:yes gene_type:complete